MSTKLTYDSLFKEVQELEDDISVLTGKINESIRNLIQNETEANNLLINWRQKCIQDSKVENCVDKIGKLNEKDKKEHEKYQALKKEKDEKQQLLRKNIFRLLRTQPPQKEKKQDTIDVVLQKSSVISGTSKSYNDKVDLSRLFKGFFITESQYPVQITKWEPVKKKNQKKSKSKEVEIPESKYDESSLLCKPNPYYGSVHKGILMGSNICVKILSKLDQKQVEVLQSCYQRTRNISHPHLLPPVAASLSTEEPKVLVELAEGSYRSLHDFIVAGMVNKDAKGETKKRTEKIGFLTKLKFAKNICSAMAWLHGKESLLHLRLKPTNILFTKEWKVKVADYGLHLPQVSKTPEGWIESGHAYYYPPELLSDKSQVSNAVDVYSFGLVLYSLLADKLPYTEAKTIEELLKCIEEHPVSLDHKIYPPSIINLMNKCLSKNIKERPTFTDLANDATWDDIYRDTVSAGNIIGQKIWNHAVEESKQTSKTSIPWNLFSKVLWQELDVKFEDTEKDGQKQACVASMLNVKDGMVEEKYWFQFLKWFAPLTTGKVGGNEFINRVVELLKAPWFYGSKFDRTMSDGLINQILKDEKVMKKNKGKLPFLVRIAQEDRFCLVYYDPNTKTMNHYLISHTDFVDVGIYKYINDYATKKKLFPATSNNRSYDTEIFAKIKKLEVSKVKEGNQVRSVIQPNTVVRTTKFTTKYI